MDKIGATLDNPNPPLHWGMSRLKKTKLLMKPQETSTSEPRTLYAIIAFLCYSRVVKVMCYVHLWSDCIHF